MRHGIRIGLIGLVMSLQATAMDQVVFRDGDAHRAESGRVLVEAQDGGLLFESREHRIWTIQPDQLIQRSSDEEPFAYLERAELASALLQELGAEFQIHHTANYVICYNTSAAYAKWCGALYERLYRAWFTFWKNEGLELTEPEPLVVLVFRDRTSYTAYARPELGDAAGAVIGYYSLASNRITTYDLTGLETLRPRSRSHSLRRINQILQQPEAERMVATVIHEATHQLAFNSGLQVRFADNPLWVTEGLAIYFEAPDLSSNRGWRKIGALHPARMRTLRKTLPNRPQDSLLTLIANDERFRDTARAEQAYAEAWALCYFLIRQNGDAFNTYLRRLGEKPPLGQDSPEERIEAFEQAFGKPWQAIDAELLNALPHWR